MQSQMDLKLLLGYRSQQGDDFSTHSNVRHQLFESPNVICFESPNVICSHSLAHHSQIV